MTTLTHALIWSTIGVTLAFIVFYLMWQGWPRAVESKQLLSLALIDALVFGAAEINLIFGKGTVPPLLGLAIFAGMPLTRLWLLGLLIHYRRKSAVQP